MEKVILARIGEIALKGLNRSVFEQRMARNMRAALSDCGACHIRWSQSRYYVEPETENFDFETALERLSGVFGLVSVSPAYATRSEYSDISTLAKEVVRNILDGGSKAGKTDFTFKIETKRGLKTFPMTSPEISSEIGGDLVETFENLHVDVNHPDFILYIEVREAAYLYSEIIEAPGGMPTGTNGKACLLISGGIDSPVAGYMIAKRGVSLCAVHFYSCGACADDRALLRRHQAAGRTVYGGSACDRFELPGRAFNRFDAPVDDAHCGTRCAEKRLLRSGNRRKRRTGGKSDDAGVILYGQRRRHAGFPSSDRDG